MPKPFKTKTVKGKKLKRMIGSSRLKREKKAGQRRLMRSKDWQGLMERYEVLDYIEGSAILVHQKKYEREGPLSFKLWETPELKEKLRHHFLTELEKNELLTLSSVARIPLRLVTRLQKRERKKKAENYSVRYTERGPSIVRTFKKTETVFVLRLVPDLSEKLKQRYFYKFSNKELALISKKLGLPMWLLKTLREREREKIEKSKGFIEKLEQ